MVSMHIRKTSSVRPDLSSKIIRLHAPEIPTTRVMRVHLIRQTVVVLAKVIQDDVVAHAFRKTRYDRWSCSGSSSKKILKNHLGTQL